MSIKLKMSFKNASDKTTSFFLDNPRSDVTDTEIQAVMDNMIAKNIFNTSGGDLVSISGAQVVSTTINELI